LGVDEKYLANVIITLAMFGYSKHIHDKLRTEVIQDY